MTFTLRAATAADHADIAAFTQDTFEWGDYVDREYTKWISDASSNVVVATDDDDKAVGLAVGTLLSPAELWLHGVRVHADWRRRGVATAMFSHLCDAGHKRGATVARLTTEEWNTPAIEQIMSVDMRHTSSWLMCVRDVVATAPVTKSNGGRRRPPADRLDRAASAEAHPAYVAWTSGELGRAGRGLLGIGWRWRRLTVDDLAKAARNDALWMSPGGWVMAAVHRDTLEIGWLETSRDQAFELAKSAIDLAGELGASRIEVKVPNVPWLSATMDSLGFELIKLKMFEKPL